MRKQNQTKKKSSRPIRVAVITLEKNPKKRQVSEIAINKETLELLLNDKHQITLPADLMQRMELSDGDDVVFIQEDDGSIIMRKG